VIIGDNKSIMVSTMNYH